MRSVVVNPLLVGIDGTPAVRDVATGTEVYARSIIEALAASKADRTVRVYANATDAPPWLPSSVEWRGIPFPRAWTHWRLRQALRRERPDVTFIPSHVLPVALGLRSVVTIHDLGHRHEPRSYSRTARWYLEATTRYAARHASRLIAVSQSTADDRATTRKAVQAPSPCCPMSRPMTCPPSTRVPSRSRCRRVSRASASPPWKRWVAAPPSSHRLLGHSPRSLGRPASCSVQTTQEPGARRCSSWPATPACSSA